MSAVLTKHVVSGFTSCGFYFVKMLYMRIVNFLGGLGNQMFIYALCEHLRNVYPDERILGCYRSGSLDVHCGLEIEKVFDIKLPEATRFSNFVSILYVICKRMGWTRWENSRHFTKYDIVFDGYWLDSFFYKDIDVKKMFRFRDTLMTGRNGEILEMIVRTSSVALHVRRGDYRNSENIELFGKFCDVEYYRNAIEIIKNTVDNPVFFVFSDDIEWVRNNIRPENVVYVDINKGVDSWKDMYLMSRCRDFIIANSTFSYWAAMLSENRGTVIYPRKWFFWDNPDIFPDDWKPI